MTNTEGRTQEGRRVLKTSGLAREDWKIIRAIAEYTGTSSATDVCTIQEIRRELQELIPSQRGIGVLPGHLTNGLFKKVDECPIETPLYHPLPRRIDNFYLTDETSKTSRVMADCSSTFVRHTNFIK